MLFYVNFILLQKYMPTGYLNQNTVKGGKYEVQCKAKNKKRN